MSIFYIRYGRHDMHGENARHQEKLNIVQGWTDDGTCANIFILFSCFLPTHLMCILSLHVFIIIAIVVLASK